MNRKILVLTGILCLLAIQFVYAQKKVYTLTDILQKTLVQYPSLASKQNNIEQQQYRKQLIKTEQLPEINVQGQQSYGSYNSVAGSFFPLPGIYNTSSTSKNGTANATANLFATAALQWNVIQFGRIKAKMKVADAAIQLSTAALSEEALRLQSAGVHYYFNALQSLAQLAISRADVQRLASLLELSKTQADAGLRPAADTLLVKSNYLQSKGTINDQQAVLETGLLQLASLIGEDASSFTIDTTAYNKVNSSMLSMDSLNTHPYLQFLKSGIEFASASLKEIKRLPYPSVGLYAGAGIRGSGISNTGKVDNSLAAPWNNNNGTYLAGIGITWNLSSLYQNKVKQRIAERAVAAAKANYTEANLQLKTDYAAAESRWKQQKEKVMNAKAALQASQQAYELYVVRYENGLINLIELLQLQKTLQDAEANYTNAIGAYWNELIRQSESTGNFSYLVSQINP